MAEIFLAKRQGYSGFEKFVALKRILPTYSEHAAFREMLIHEAKLAANLQHLNVVQVLDLGAVDDQVYIAMEYIHGRDLASLLARNFRRKECIPLALALSIAIEFLTGIDYAHRLQDENGQPRNLIHRDISPQNILLSYEGEVKVTDFGIARAFSSDGGIEKLFPGSLQGKFGYMSPEQLRKQPVDQRADIFSAGVVLHELITGKRLFWHKDPKESAEQILNKKVPTPSQANSDIPPEIDVVVMKALERNRENRYQTIGSLLGDLTKVAESLQVHISRRDIAVYMRRHFGTNSPRPRSTDTQRARSLTLPKISLASSFSATSGLRTPVGDLLINKGRLTVSQLDIGLAQQRARGGRIGEILIEQGVISGRALIAALGEQLDLKVFKPDELLTKPPSSLIFDAFPYEAAESMAVLALDIATEEKGRASIVVSDPLDERTLLETKIILGVNELEVGLSTKDEIKSAIYHWYNQVGKAEDETLMFNIKLPLQEPLDSDRPANILVVNNTQLTSILKQEFTEQVPQIIETEDTEDLFKVAASQQPSVIVLTSSEEEDNILDQVKTLRAQNAKTCLYVIRDILEVDDQIELINAGADDLFSSHQPLAFVVAKIKREMSRLPKRSPASLITKSHNIGVSGSLHDMTFVDVIQSIELAQKTAVVSFAYDDGRVGTVITSNGKIRTVTTNNPDATDGNVNFHELAKPGNGHFKILYQESDAPSNVTENNTQLLLEAIRKHTEKDLISEQSSSVKARHTEERPQQQAPLANGPYEYPSEEDSTTELRIETLKNLAKSQGGNVDDSNIFTWSPVISEKASVLNDGVLQQTDENKSEAFEVEILDPSDDTRPTPLVADSTDAETEMAFDAAGLLNQLAKDENQPIAIDKNNLLATPSPSDILEAADPLETLDSHPIQSLPSSPIANLNDLSADLIENEGVSNDVQEFQAKEERMGPDEPAAPKYNLNSDQDIFALPELEGNNAFPDSKPSTDDSESGPLPLPSDALTALSTDSSDAALKNVPRKKSEGQNLARLNLQKVAVKRDSASSANSGIQEKVNVQHINLSGQELSSESWSQNSESSVTEAEELEDIVLTIDDIVTDDDEELF